jgi:protein SCO1/2
MARLATASALSETQFAALIDALAADPARYAQLTEMLREDHPIYHDRGAATVVRMRGWILLAMARVGVSDAALIFVLEELDTGVDAYLVAGAARALRSYSGPTQNLTPFLMRALSNIRYRDEPVSFENYGEYATSSTGTTAVRELLSTLAWLGRLAREALPELQTLRGERSAFSRKFRIDIDRALHAIRVDETGTQACCAAPGLANMALRPLSSRGGAETIESLAFQDHRRDRITFKEFFHGQPSVVVFFYTRCDNPLKCSLTITKLARIQNLLAAQGFADRIRTGAITYDPAYDLPERLFVYGQDRGVHMSAEHRLLRATDGMEMLCSYFKLGVNFIESLVNRHRVEAYILDGEGRIAVSFERLHFDEQQVVTHAINVLRETESGGARLGAPGRTRTSTMFPPPDFASG